MIKPDFEKGDGLIPVIAQEAETGEVLMLAYMNEEAFNATLETGKASYYSRSRGKFWMKGESSGNTQEVQEVRMDCDNDTIVLKIKQIGDAACHTGHRSCFYKKLEKGNWIEEGELVFDPKEVYGK